MSFLARNSVGGSSLKSPTFFLTQGNPSSTEVGYSDGYWGYGTTGSLNPTTVNCLLKTGYIFTLTDLFIYSSTTPTQFSIGVSGPQTYGGVGNRNYWFSKIEFTTGGNKYVVAGNNCSGGWDVFTSGTRTLWRGQNTAIPSGQIGIPPFKSYPNGTVWLTTIYWD